MLLRCGKKCCACKRSMKISFSLNCSSSDGKLVSKIIFWLQRTFCETLENVLITNFRGRVENRNDELELSLSPQIHLAHAKKPSKKRTTTAELGIAFQIWRHQQQRRKSFLSLVSPENSFGTRRRIFLMSTRRKATEHKKKGRKMCGKLRQGPIEHRRRNFLHFNLIFLWNFSFQFSIFQIHLTTVRR